MEGNGRKRSYRCHLDRWLDEVVGIEGLPIPFGAPNASPHVERLNRTLREDALDHFIFLSEDHVRRAVAEYVRYYNGARPSRAIHGIPDPYSEIGRPPTRGGRLVALPAIRRLRGTALCAGKWSACGPPQAPSPRSSSGESLRTDFSWTTVELIAPHRRNRSRPRTQDGRPLRRYRRRRKVERTFAWFGAFRRLLVRHEHRVEIYRAFFHVACLIIAPRQL